MGGSGMRLVGDLVEVSGYTAGHDKLKDLNASLFPHLLHQQPLRIWRPAHSTPHHTASTTAVIGQSTRLNSTEEKAGDVRLEGGTGGEWSNTTCYGVNKTDCRHYHSSRPPPFTLPLLLSPATPLGAHC